MVMLRSVLLCCQLTACAAAVVASPASAFGHAPSGVDFVGQRRNVSFINWRTYKANGVNLGAWLEKEKSFDPVWWNRYAPDAPDEWTFCQTLGSECATIMETRYTSFLNFTTIDRLASVGVDTLRIPTTYAAWIQVPGSQLLHGNQKAHLMAISRYAITRYNMHVIIGLHSLPGGVNSLDIGEAFGHSAWFQNETNLAYSYKTVAAVLDFIVASGHKSSFTLAPINEAADNVTNFAFPAGLTDAGRAWVLKYFQGVLDLRNKVDSRIPVMFQDCFQGASYWAPFFNASDNIVFDTHIYYFAIPGATPSTVHPMICERATGLASETKFPTYVGEWSLQVDSDNSLGARLAIFNTQRYAWQYYASGSSFWTAVSYNVTQITHGEGSQRDYWSYVDLIDAGVVQRVNNETFC